MKFDRRICWSKNVLSGNQNLSGINEKYDIFVAGSDQIWNPNFSFVGDLEYLTFASKEKRFAYAASFGVDILSSDSKECCAKMLNDMNLISVREKSGAAIVEELTNKKVQVVVDPTMLLKKEEWEKVEKAPNINKINGKYILLYFLGGTSVAVKDILKNIGENCEVINIMDQDSNGNELPVGPAEFVWLIHHAECVITDSFHGSVFSILMHTPFINVERELNKADGDMNTRLESLLEMFSLERCRYVGEKTDYKQILEMDFEDVDKELNRQREMAEKFLDKILNFSNPN